MSADRITELEVGLRRAIHLIERLMPYVMWPDTDYPTLEGEGWAHTSLDLVKEALAGKKSPTLPPDQSPTQPTD